MVPYGKEVIAVAAGQLKPLLQEKPRGSNDGPELRAFLSASGFEPGQAWCLYFAMQCARKGVPLDQALWFRNVLTGGCDELLSLAHRQGHAGTDFSTGAIFLLLHPDGDAFHAGIAVADNGDGTMQTLEGNTNDDGGREGWKVCRHTRRIDACRFVYW